jgi:hypothetical protein
MVTRKARLDLAFSAPALPSAGQEKARIFQVFQKNGVFLKEVLSILSKKTTFFLIFGSKIEDF